MDVDQPRGTQNPAAMPQPGEYGFVPLADTETLDQLLARSHDAPVLIFLNDPYCPISRRARHEMERLPEATRASAYLVDVSRQHALSRAIEERTGVRHESPQALILRDGKAVWDASHFAIAAEDVTEVLAAHA